MRLQGLDIFRGYALLMMISFHFSFDLNNFHIVTLDLKHGLFWHYYKYLIVTMFVFSSGMSMHLANAKGINFKKLRKRIFMLAIASALVTIGSYTQFPHTWIYFGILHFFLFATIFGLFFLKSPILSIVVGSAILLGYNYSFMHMHWLFNLLKGPLHLPVIYTEDLANIVPWFGVFLLGNAFAYYKLEYLVFDNAFFNHNNFMNRFFSFMGKHSLLIYLLHQPILFGFFIFI